jgi:hypothetical protein
VLAFALATIGSSLGQMLAVAAIVWRGWALVLHWLSASFRNVLQLLLRPSNQHRSQ